jgi:hypothetical protein
VEPHVGALVPTTSVVTSASARRLRPWLARVAAGRVLEVKIKVGCATHGCITAICSSVHGVHRGCTFTCHILVGFSLEVLIIAPEVIIPRCIKIDLWADGVAVLVLGFTILVVAILSATNSKQICRGRTFQKYVHIALNLLSGRPINLAILLKALLVFIGPGVFGLASSPAFVVPVIAIQVVTGLELAILNLAFCLRTVTLGILVDIFLVGVRACFVQTCPALMRTLEHIQLLLDPSASGIIHVNLSD